MVENTPQSENQRIRSEGLISEGLIDLTLKIYASPISTDELQVQAMDTFDVLMKYYNFSAKKLLAEYDHR